jgi:hypothetical protein
MKNRGQYTHSPISVGQPLRLRAGRVPALLLLSVALAFAQQQPIAFSHAIHAGQYKIDCQFCHSGARRSAVSGIPSLQFCMGCHKTVSPLKPEIARVRAYWDRKEPIRWTRVVQEPGFVFFNHSPHILKGVRCQECHGPVETMTEVRLDHSLNMDACTGCHRRRNVSIDCYTCHR